MDDILPILERVRVLIERLAPAPVCGDCLAERLGDIDREAISLALHELAGGRDFERENGVCSLCGAPRQTLRKRK